MGVLKLSVLEERNKELQRRMRSVSKDGKPYHVSNCGCPCECLIKEGDIRLDYIEVTGSWNID